MINVTREQIEAAKDGDAEAVEHLLSEADERVQQVATRALGGQTFGHFSHEDMAQDARIALWQGLNTMRGADPAMFFSFANRTAGFEAAASRRANQRTGVSPATAARCLSASRHANSSDQGSPPSGGPLEGEGSTIRILAECALAYPRTILRFAATSANARSRPRDPTGAAFDARSSSSRRAFRNSTMVTGQLLTCTPIAPYIRVSI